jgi:hypothetical protein
MYLTGVERAETRRAAVAGYALGVMVQPTTGHFARHLADYPAWAADNGCFSRGASFDLATYLAWLAAMPWRERCLFATAPDVVGDAAATWARSVPILPAIRALGYKAALVAQDGIERTEIDWPAFDCLFIGGTTAWKLSETAYALIGEAKERGKWVHVGRVNSLRRLRAASFAGADSADGTFLKVAPDINMPRMLRWLDVLQRQPHLAEGRTR